MQKKFLVHKNHIHALKNPRLLRNHGLQENANLQDKILENQKDYIKNMVGKYLEIICMKKKDYTRRN